MLPNVLNRWWGANNCNSESLYSSEYEQISGSSGSAQIGFKLKKTEDITFRFSLKL